MKNFAVLRHAKSSWKDTTLADFDRPLNARGQRSAVRIGEELHHLGLGFDLVIASTAVRVRETLAGVEMGYGEALTVRFEPRIYEAPLQALLEIIRDTGDEVQRLLVVGHNPGCSRLGAFICRTDDPLYLDVAAHFPTGAFLRTELPAECWQDVRPGTGRILNFLKPRELC